MIAGQKREQKAGMHTSTPLSEAVPEKVSYSEHQCIIFLALKQWKTAYCKDDSFKHMIQNIHLLLTSSISSSSSPISSNWISSSSPGPNVSVSLILAKKGFREVKECTHTKSRQTEYSCPIWTSNLKWKDSYRVLEAPHMLSDFWLHLHCTLE